MPLDDIDTVPTGDFDETTATLNAIDYYADILEMRVDEALTGAFRGDARASEAAQAELDALMRVKKALIS